MLAPILFSYSLSLGLGEPALTEPAPPRLTWEAPAACPDAAQVEERAQRLAGLDEAAASLRLRGRVEHRPEHPQAPWHLELVVSTDEGEHARSLDAAQCEALADVTALVLALGLDPFGVEASVGASVVDTGRSENSDAPTPDEAPPPRVTRRPPPVEAELAVRAEAPRRSPHAGYDGVGFGLRLLAGGELGALPGGSGGGRLAAALLIRRFRFEAHADYWLPRPARLADGGGMGVDVRLATGGVDLCVRLYAARRLELPVCAGAELGLMRADAVGTPEPHRSHSVYAAARLAPAITWRVADWVGLWLGVEGTLALSRPRFRFGDDVVYTPAPAGGRVLAGVEFGF